MFKLQKYAKIPNNGLLNDILLWRHAMVRLYKNKYHIDMDTFYKEFP